MSTRARKVGQGVTKKELKFRIWRQTDVRVICTVVSLIQLHTKIFITSIHVFIKCGFF